MYKDVCFTYCCWSNWKITRLGKASRENSSVVLRHGRTCSKKCVERYSDLENKKTEQLSKFQVLAWMIKSNRKNLNQSENYQKFAHKSFLKGTWHELEDLTFCGPWTSLQDQSQNGLRRATKSLARLISYIHHANDFPRLKICWRSWWLEINLRRSLVYLSKQNISSWSWMCKKRYPTALQDLKSFLWMDCEWMDYLLSLEHCDRGITFNHRYCPTMMASRKLVRDPIPMPRPKMSEGKRLICLKWIMYPLTHILLKASLSCTSF